MGSSCRQPHRCVATGSRVRPTKRSSGQRSSSGREEMGCRSASLAMRCDIVGPITAKQRKNERKQSNGYSLEIYSGERKYAKVAATVSTLVGRSVLISLVPSVAEADVATVDGLESTIKSARDRKRWKLATV
ncbi:hypothetical protein BHE74_00023379 [Ensete ventricosum]|nr:hypothetical protein BHE74_00023379 [Ensete ventricosum]